MPPARPLCPNCEEQPLRELECDGELAGFVCSGASEAELETRAGCGTLLSTKEYKELKQVADVKNKIVAHTPAKSSAAAGATTTPARPLGGMRRPLASLHGNTLHNRSSLHAPKLGSGSKPASSAAGASAASAAVAASAVAAQPASSSPSSALPTAASKPAAPAKKTLTPAKPPTTAPSKAKATHGDDDDDDEGDGAGDSSEEEDGGAGGGEDDDEGEDDEEEEEGATPSAGSGGVTSTSTTPTKQPPSPSLTPARAKASAAVPKPAAASKAKSATSKAAVGKKGSSTGASKLVAPSPIASSSALGVPDGESGPLSKEARLSALKAKLAAKHRQAQEEFASKYGADGDADTAEERLNADRKQSGQAEEDFFAGSQGGESNIKRAPLVDSLSIKGAENPLAESHRKPWTPPRAFGEMNSDARKLLEGRAKAQFVVGRRLGARARIFSGSFMGFKQLSPPEPPPEQEMLPPPPPVVKAAPDKLAEGDTYEPLPIWVPTAEELALNPNLTQVEVPYLVCKWLRPHQREGVKFMCECVLGQRNLFGQQPQQQAAVAKEGGEGGEGAPSAATSNLTDNPGAGAILADDMGLGKTLQSVALVYTLLTQGFERGHPVARKVIIVTPTSLVSNWRNECDKWLGKGTISVVALSEVGKDNIECGLDSFTARNSKHHVLIISYDTFRRHVDKLRKPGLCDLLICDEAHRLKNNKTSTYTALDSLPTKRRVLLSGTPMQNDLSEFFSMINFTNRRILGDQKAFRKYYELPILLGREPEALEQEAEEGAVRSAELSAIVNQFVLRRTNVLLKKHLPPKVIQVVCCRPSALQVQLYQHFLASKSVRRLTSMDEDGEGKRGGGGLQALPLITSLKKLCNHPKLIYDTANAATTAKGAARGLSFTDDTGAVEKIPPALVAMFKSMKPLFDRYDQGAFARNPSAAAYSGKMYVLERLLAQVRASSTDRVVIVSNFTSALDVIATMCQARKWDHLRLDGTTSIKKRQQLVDQLSDHRGNKVFCFLLSSRAGGCGLNLIGANRLILFDPDWNPAVDKQAAARVWRDGQTKRCFVYRFLTTGTIEEKVYQRQLSKEGLSGVLGGSTADASLTKDELRDLFQLDQKALETPSDTHTSLACDCLDSFQIRTEEEAAKADEAQKAESERHAREVAQAEEEARRKEKERAAEEGGADDMEVEPGAPSAAAASADQVEGVASPAVSASAATGASDAVMVDGETGVDAGGEGDGGGEGGVPSEEDEEGDDDGADLDGFVVSGSDDDEEDYGSKPKKGSAAAKANKSKGRKKDGPRKQRKKKATIGSLNFPALHALTTPTLGQRGEPPEEELINWAHHATSNSIPDPAFRLATKNMPFVGSTNLPYVSFVFSCEISGRPLVGTSDADDALKVSARCEAEPEKVAASKSLVVSAADALAKHADFMRDYHARQKKRAGIDSDEEIPDLIAHPELRRHSARVPKPVQKNNTRDVPDAPEADDDFDVEGEEGDGGDEEGGRGSSAATAGRKRKTAPSVSAAAQFHPDALKDDSMDEESRALIEIMLAQDSGLKPKGRGRGRPAKAAAASPKKAPSPRKSQSPAKKRAEEAAAADKAAMSDVAEESDEEDNDSGAEAAGSAKAAAPAAAEPSSSDDDDVQEVTSKKARTASPASSSRKLTVPARKPAVAAADTDSDSSSVCEVAAPPARSSIKPFARPASSLAQLPRPSAALAPRSAPAPPPSQPEVDDFLED